MTLDKQQIPLAMNQGLDTKTDPKQLQPGKFLTIENGVFLQGGELKKCNGYVKSKQDFNTFDNEGAPGIACGTLKDQMFLLTKKSAISYASSLDVAGLGTQAYTQVGFYAPIEIKKNNAINQNVVSPSCAYNPAKKTLLKVWSEQETTILGTESVVKYSATDSTDNSLCFPEKKIASGKGPLVVTNDNLDYFVVVYEDNTSPNPSLKAAAIEKANLNNRTIVTLDTSPGYTGQYAFSLYIDRTTGDKAYVTWCSGAGKVNTKIAYFSGTYATFAAPTAVTLTGVSSANGAAMIQIPFIGIMFAFVTPLNVKCITYNLTLTSVVAPLFTVMTTTAPAYYKGCVMDFYSFNSVDGVNVYATIFNTVPADSLPSINVALVVSGSTVGNPELPFLYHAALAGNAVIDTAYLDPFPATNGRRYLPVTVMQSYDNAFPYYLTGKPSYSNYLIETKSRNNKYYVAAKYYDLNSAGIDLVSDHPRITSFVRDDINNRWFGIVREAVGNASLCTISFDHKPVFAEMANNLHCSGGYLGMYDGAEFAEHGFFQQPVQPVISRTGAGSVAVGTYYYSVTYQWQDAYGQIYESVPSDPIAFTVTGAMGASTLRVAVPNLQLTNKISQSYITVYRSADGINFYQLPNTGINGDYANPNGDIDFSRIWSTNVPDNNTTTALLSRPLLYTSGGELSNAQAPACTHVAVYKRRLILVPSEDVNSVWYSKEIIPATSGSIGTPVLWAFEFVLSVDERGGPIIGTVQLDDKLIIGKSSTISVVTGEGPANSGALNDFSTPQIIATDTGFESGRALVVTPIGVLFKSPKGYYLLDRSLTVSYIGAPVEALNALPCVSGTLLFDRNEVWFGTSSNQIIYNYYFNLWTTATFAWTHACNYQSKYTGILDLALYKETLGIYRRENKSGISSGYALKVITGWVSFANVQGYQRVYKLLLLGTFKSNHQLQVQVSFDFVETPTQTTTFSITGTANDPLQYRVFLNRQKCESVKFTVLDSALSGTFAESYSLSNMAFEMGVKRGLNKLPASKSVG